LFVRHGFLLFAVVLLESTPLLTFAFQLFGSPRRAPGAVAVSSPH